MHELGSIDVMMASTRRSGQSRHVGCASSCMSMRTSLEEGIKLHRFAGIFPEQFLTEAGRHREAVVAADQRMVVRCCGDYLASFVHDFSHAPFFGGSRAMVLIWIMCGDHRIHTLCKPSRRGFLKRLNERPRGKRHFKIGEASGLKRSLTNGRGIVPSHVDDRHRISSRLQAIPQLNARPELEVDVQHNAKSIFEIDLFFECLR
jgi:hypothetical protein